MTINIKYQVLFILYHLIYFINNYQIKRNIKNVNIHKKSQT